MSNPLHENSNSENLVQEIVQSLVDWYHKSARDLPWRKTRNPYFIWVSEIMLQQTRVDTVIPYYEKFLKRFPSVEVLAAAEPEAVLEQWSGLGYYRRAKHLHQAAREVVESHGGKLPNTALSLQRLSGIGAYTAGAIASIAFEEPAPIVDGNVARVLTRVFAMDRDIKSKEGTRWLWNMAKQLVPQKQPGMLNQALMELGALICLPTGPKCSDCPLRDHCKANALKTPEVFPVASSKAKVKNLQMTSLVVFCNGELLFGRRPVEQNLYGGLWEPILIAKDQVNSLSKLVQDAAWVLCGHVKHLLTHRTFEVDVFATKVRIKKNASSLMKSDLGYVKFAWSVPQARTGQSALSKKLIAAVPGYFYSADNIFKET